MFNFFKKANLLIIGAQKCGTTSLHYYLSQHNNITGSDPKEVDFFSYDLNYAKGSIWYHRHFAKNNKYLLDSSVEYMYIPNCWKRILKYNPDTKIIAILRDPIDRAYSAYNMYKKLNEGHGLKYYENHIKGQSIYLKKRMLDVLKHPDFPSFKEFIKVEMELFQNSKEIFWYEPGFLSRGIYYNQLKPFYENFQHENMLVIDSQRLKQRKQETLFKIIEWLKLKPIEGLNLDDDHLVGNYSRKSDSKLDETLRSFFQAHNERLFNLIKMDFNWK